MVKVVDCTLRDGGYYNEWDFSRDLIEKYVSSMCRAGVDVLELGFRSPHADRYLGPTAFTTDEFIDSLDVGTSTAVAVMVNAKDFTRDPEPVALVNRVFRSAGESRVDLVRIAANLGDLPHLQAVVTAVQELGYQVAVNLMQISNCTTDQVEAFGRDLRAWGVDVAYVADSFGGLLPSDIPPIIETLSGSFGGPVGCHLHDNMTYALSSTLAAVDAGATWVDGTLLGMGRGPGNVRTEYLSLELAQAGRSSIDIVPLIDVVTGEMAELQREYGWGTNLYYFMSALYGVHPTYIMELTKDGRYGPEEIVSALESLRGETGAQYGREQLAAAMSGGSSSYPGTASLSGWCSGETVLIVGPGPSALDNKTDIERYIEDARPVVIGLNAHSVIRQDLIGAVAACHPTRIAMDAAELAKLDKPLFAPKVLLDQAGVTTSFVHDLGVETSAEGFSLGEGTVGVPEMLVAAYALAAAALGQARRILLVGFDGYGANDPRQAEMVNVFEAFGRLPDAPPLLALTRTTYPIPQSSIHADF